MSYRVLCQSASGREIYLDVRANTGTSAAARAVRIAEREYPGQGWRAVWTLAA